MAPSARGQGVGDAAVTAVLDWAGRQTGVDRVALWVRAHIAPALALFSRNGFVPPGGDCTDGEPELCLARALTGASPA